MRTKSVRLALLTAALLAGAPACAPPSADLVVVICIDTLRADHVSSAGYFRETTPRIDALAASGMRFTRAFATSSWTVPSVSSLLTSREVFEHGAGVPGETKNLSDVRPPVQFGPDTRQLAELLSDAGIETGLFAANPFFYGRLVDGFATREVERVDARALTDRVLTWLDRTAGAPRRFAYVHYMDVHQPNRPPEPYFNFFPSPDGSAREERHADWSWGQLRDPADPAFRSFRDHRIAAYDGAIRFVDDQIGALIDRLRASGTLDRTLLLVTADHGEEFWDHATAEAAWNDDPRGLWGIGHGHTLYDELLAVPLVLSGPGVPSGARTECAASLIDVAPTVLRAFGLEPAGLRGRDLRGRDFREEPCPARDLFAGALAYGPESATVRSGDLKLVLRRGHDPELFDLTRDPGELRNLAQERSDETRRLRTALIAALTAAPPARTTATEIDADRVRDLRALGYLQ